MNDILEYIEDSMKMFNFIDISKLLPMLDNSDLDYKRKYELLTKVNVYNSKLIKEIERENEQLKNLENYEIKNISFENISSNNVEVETNNKPLKLDVSTHLQNVLNMTCFEEINEYINNSITKEQYEDTINSIISKVLREKITIKKLKNEEYLEKGIIITEFDEELQKYDFILECLYRMQNNLINNNIKQEKNKIIYLTTTYGNINITSDLKCIPIEFYDSFYTLFCSIQDGSFKNFKRIGKQNANYKTSLLQIRDNFTRVIFDQINPNTYIVLSLFLKKVSTSKDYNSNLRTIDNLLYCQLDNINYEIENNTEEFINKNEQITEILFEKLLTKNKELNLDEYIRKQDKIKSYKNN